MTTFKSRLVSLSDYLFDASADSENFSPRWCANLDYAARLLEWLGGRRYSSNERVGWGG